MITLSALASSLCGIVRPICFANATQDKKVTLEELMVSTLAMTDVLANLMIATSLITEAAFKASWGTERRELFS